MSQPTQRIQGSKTVADVERQTNVALERINGQIGSGSAGGVSNADFVALQAEVATLKNLSGGFSDIGGTGAGSVPPNPTDGTVATDGATITGDGVSFPIALVVPVTLPNGGTGLVQSTAQQIITLGTSVAAGTAQAQPALTLAGVTGASAAIWSIPNIIDATWQTGICVIVVCSPNTVTLYLVNPTAAPITPKAQSVNIKVIA